MKLEIDKFDYFGRGIGYNNKKIIFVDKALPREIVDASITKEKKDYCNAKTIEIIKKSKDRIKPLCPNYSKCGGCYFLHATYNLEKKFKIEKAKELLGRCDSFHETSNLNYRNKVTLHVKDNKIGLFEEKTNNLVNINYCHLLNDRINKVINDLNKINMNDYHITKIIIKCNQDKLLLSLDGKIDETFINQFDYVDTIICKNKIVKGKGYLKEIIDNKVFKITQEAFFQINREALININHIIKYYLNNKNIHHALDLYSGTSLWGILISNNVGKVTSVEINKEACQNALANIKNNNIENINVINGKVEDYIDTFKDIDLVIIDPPRSGLDKKTREYLKRINSRYLIYISCDMLSLKRDLEDLKSAYKIEMVNLVDMFKRTYHCEVVTILEVR